MAELTQDIKEIVDQSIATAKCNYLREARLIVPSGYENKVFSVRDDIKTYVESLGYTYKDSGLPDWASNGWSISETRHPFDNLPDDMVQFNKDQRVQKRGTTTAKNLRIWVLL